jgi:DNA-binding MarR family transcriptional regulator
MGELSQRQLEQQVIECIKNRDRAYPSDIVADLKVPYFSVTDVIKRLIEKGVLEPTSHDKDSKDDS